MILLLFIRLAAARSIELSKLVIGEWSVAAVRSYVHQVDFFRKLTFEFHPVAGSSLIEGTIWHDEIGSTEPLLIDSFLLAHLEVELDGEMSGKIFTRSPDREFRSNFRFRPIVPGVSFSTKVRLFGNWSLDLRLLADVAAFTAVASTRGLSDTVEYSAKKRPKQVAAASTGRGWIIGGVSVAVAAVSLLIVKKRLFSVKSKAKKE